ncbi:hypothetical protein CGC58_06355 [Capnocytophaga stomatis]|uniref:Lipoprotein n=1 Tax=Capnocytophaga stomatis TaxID=1848904 RepID=A0A250FW81_9FLAO|nr:hypothetical protein [Capnocytophaga stomatis]ATA89380.1 hypothetical protein CGC58_06355 [Capnocytophaga stomatis]
MKPITLLALLLLVVTGCCKKEDEVFPKDTLIAQGEITDWGSPAVDGCGWLIKIDESTFAMDNFDEKFKVNSLKVKVHYLHTDFHYLCGRGGKPFRIIKILKMEKL